MAEEEKSGRKEALFMRECYETALRFEASVPSQDMLRKHLESIPIPEAEETDEAAVSAKNSKAAAGKGGRSEKNIAAERRSTYRWGYARVEEPEDEEEETVLPLPQQIERILRELALNESQNNCNIGQMAEELPDCAEKEYILALLALRKGRSRAYRLEAAEHLRSALWISPGEPLYLALAEVLQNVGV